MGTLFWLLLAIGFLIVVEANAKPENKFLGALLYLFLGFMTLLRMLVMRR
ncbi:MAG TPA: hypothetical protein VFV11_07440 [Solimonas sp.]|nr:hypothetical protein [Solimonas sp.]